jgi:hypothetical protein
MEQSLLEFVTQSPVIPYLVDDASSRQSFHDHFDVSPFAFSHQLHHSGLFSYDALLALAGRVATKGSRFYIEQGETSPQKGWTPHATGRTVVEHLQDVARDHSLVMLKRVNEEPEYNEVLHRLQAELSALTGVDIPRRYRDGLMTILITSPRRVTPYHIDGEANLLMQMSGTKSVYIFDGEDRAVLPSHELEGFWSGDIKAPVYKEHLQSEARRFDLAPGAGVTNPVTFPHWVQNGPELSISLSVNFKRVVDDKADAYRVNKQLRRLGLHPLEPGKVKTVDRTKGMVYRTAKRVKQYVAARPAK